MKKMKSSFLLCGMFFISSLSMAAEAVENTKGYEVCYEPIYRISERRSTISSFSTTCTSLGRFYEGDDRSDDMEMALRNIDAAVERAKNFPGKLTFNDIRVKIFAGARVMYIDQSGSGMRGDTKFLLTKEELAKVERVLGAIYDCMRYHEEKKLKKK